MVSPFGGSSTALKFLVGHSNKGIHSFIHSFVNIKCTNESHRDLAKFATHADQVTRWIIVRHVIFKNLWQKIKLNQYYT